MKPLYTEFWQHCLRMMYDTTFRITLHIRQNYYTVNVTTFHVSNWPSTLETSSAIGTCRPEHALKQLDCRCLVNYWCFTWLCLPYQSPSCSECKVVGFEDVATSVCARNACFLSAKYLITRRKTSGSVMPHFCIMEKWPRDIFWCNKALYN